MEEKRTITDTIIGGLKGAAAELEELQVQIALGKAEARDKYEEVKKSFSQKMHEAKLYFQEIKTDEKILPHINAFEFLQVQLVLGATETKEMFEEQEKRISQAIHQLETSLKRNNKWNTFHHNLHLEIEKFKMKLALLSLHYKLQKTKAGYDFEERKNEFHMKLEQFKERISAKETKVKQQWEHFADEMAEAYTHLRKAFS